MFIIYCLLIATACFILISKGSRIARILIALLLLSPLSVPLGLVGEDAPAKPHIETQEEWEERAFATCRMLIRGLLRNPGSVQWLSQRVSVKGDTYYFRIAYRAQNGFGGMNQEAYTCESPGPRRAAPETPKTADLRPRPRPAI